MLQRERRSGKPFANTVIGADVALSAGGSLIALAVPGTGAPHAEIWDVRQRSRVATLTGGSDGDSLSVALSADGRLLALGGYSKVVRIWDIRGHG